METPSRIENLSRQDEIVVALPRITGAIHLQSRSSSRSGGSSRPSRTAHTNNDGIEEEITSPFEDQ